MSPVNLMWWCSSSARAVIGRKSLVLMLDTHALPSDFAINHLLGSTCWFSSQDVIAACWSCFRLRSCIFWTIRGVCAYPMWQPMVKAAKVWAQAPSLIDTPSSPSQRIRLGQLLKSQATEIDWARPSARMNPRESQTCGFIQQKHVEMLSSVTNSLTNSPKIPKNWDLDHHDQRKIWIKPSMEVWPPEMGIEGGLNQPKQGR